MAEKNTAVANVEKKDVIDKAIDSLAAPMTTALGKLAIPAIFLGNKLGDCLNKGIDKGFDLIFESNEKNK